MEETDEMKRSAPDRWDIVTRKNDKLPRINAD
jgi:hypothetical protein